ncbi:putative aldehyde dehydrogenase [Pseudomonas aeruginosa]|nr:putative aldehyde dehydrogenase [Pseudomonas aeruginosa]
MVARIIAEAPSLPAGAVNIFSESGSEGARRLIDAAEVPVISFTGSSATGRAISAAGARHLKRFGLELGGKTPHLMFDDADLDAALPVLEKSLTVFAGQFCMTGSRLLVQRGVAERLRERLAQRLENLRGGAGGGPAQRHGAADRQGQRRARRASRTPGHRRRRAGGGPRRPGNRGRAGGRRLLPSDPAGGR